MPDPARREPAESLSAQASRALEEMLVTLRLPPGALVQEKDLVEAVGIGRTPVREAVQKLAAHGLVRIMPRKGLQVTPVLRSELRQVIEARRVTERLLVVKAAERATPDQRSALESLAVHIEGSGADPEAWLRHDRRLDELLASACGNAFLVNALAPLHAHCRRLWYLHRDRPDPGRALRLHAELARSVAGGDGSGAIRALNGIIGMLEELVGGLDAVS